MITIILRISAVYTHFGVPLFVPSTSKVWNYLLHLLDPTLERLTKFKAKNHSNHAMLKACMKNES